MDKERDPNPLLHLLTKEERSVVIFFSLQDVVILTVEIDSLTLSLEKERVITDSF